MKPDATRQQLAEVVRLVKSRGLKVDISAGQFQTVIGIIGDEKKIDFDQLRSMPGVYDAIRIRAPYRLMSRSYLAQNISVKIRSDVILARETLRFTLQGPALSKVTSSFTESERKSRKLARTSCAEELTSREPLFIPSKGWVSKDCVISKELVRISTFPPSQKFAVNLMSRRLQGIRIFSR